MVTLLNCIERIPSLIDTVLDKFDESFAAFDKYYEERKDKINEIVFVGSGTSNTVSITARPFVEKVTGICTKAVYPNDLIDEDCVYNKNALYVFVSQTGTSAVVREVMMKLAGLGFACVSFTEAEGTLLADVSPCHVVLNCGQEEYGMRTIGYTISVLNLMLMGIRIGVKNGRISEEKYNEYIEDCRKVPDSHRKITKDAEVWFEHNKRKFMRSDSISFTGSDEFYGLSLEAAVKFWEMPQVVSIGYELEEGMHGPNYGYSYPHCVVVFNDGGRDSEKAKSLARYMKEVFDHGLMIGEDVIDEDDLKIDAKSRYFKVLEYSAAPQVASYFLTIDGGRDLLKKADHTVMNSYFMTHTEKKG